VTIGYTQQQSATQAVFPVGRLPTDGVDILAALRLHAAERTRVGYVTTAAPAPDGPLGPAIDSFVHHSAYCRSAPPLTTAGPRAQRSA
jgi:hypothetical protein